MNPKQKAKELVDKFSSFAASPDGNAHLINAKHCAIICIDEAMLAASTALTIVDRRKENQGIDDIIDTDDILNDSCIPYWNEVKKQIQDL